MRTPLTILFAVGLAVAAVGCGTSGGSDASDDTTAPSTRSTTSKIDSSSSSTTRPATTTESTRGTGGPDRGEATEADYVKAMIANLSNGDPEGGDLVLPAKDAACVGPKWVAAMTVDAFRTAKVAPAEVSDPSFDGARLKLDEDQAQAMYDAFGDCGLDAARLFAASLSLGFTAEQQACVADNVDAALVNELLVKTFSDGDADAAFEKLLADLAKDCKLPGG